MSDSPIAGFSSDACRPANPGREITITISAGHGGRAVISTSEPLVEIAMRRALDDGPPPDHVEAVAVLMIAAVARAAGHREGFLSDSGRRPS